MFVYHFDVYTGLKGSGGERSVDLDPKVIKEMVSKLPEGRHYHIFSDNFFTSVDLALYLKEKGHQFTGIIKNNRKGLPNPNEWKLLEKKKKKKKK